MMKKEFQIGSRIIGEGHPAYIIAEMSANHAGSIERAKEIIRAAKESGADCIKIQTYTPDTITINCYNEYFQIEKGTWEGENLYGLYGKAYTPWEWQQELKEEADRVGLDFLSTPFDPTAVDFLEGIGLEFYKIASLELVDIPLISYVASKGKPIIMSTGMATFEEIEEAVAAVKEAGNDRLVLMKCSSAYPADPADMHLSTIADLREKMNLPIGLSDHSMGSMSAATAVALGACVIEKHFCISREIENPDSSFSMNPEEFAQMVKDVRSVEAALGKPTYGVCKQEESNYGFRRSLFAVKDIAKGEIFTAENVRSIRPSHGMKPVYIKDILGLKAGKALAFGTPLTFDALEKDAELFLTSDDEVKKICESRKDTGKKAFCIQNKITLDMIRQMEPARIYICNYNHEILEEIMVAMKDKVEVFSTPQQLAAGLEV